MAGPLSTAPSPRVSATTTAPAARRDVLPDLGNAPVLLGAIVCSFLSGGEHPTAFTAENTTG
ncbi:hypothetical protein Aph01nite_55120 [Acrocarpospora phusangensis]|uniref:Uncharacterized protein n=1 Tax=Acrocarpospora phusangensis TaxID=1070424 RepID=A0A919QE03_9ACTN|nr:hypothetical protein Aph01nite_55120 [Acrocarpospora phusangensis]